MDSLAEDLSNYHAEYDGYDAWFYKCELSLVEDFFEKHELEPHEDLKLWNSFVEARYAGRHNAN